MLNRALLAGLQLGVSLTQDLNLRTHLRQLAQQLALTVSPIKLTAYLLAQTYQALDRRTVAYEPALKLIEILFAGQSLGQDAAASDIRLPGFLFDMNHFFQALVGRFLAENLPGYILHEEYPLHCRLFITLSTIPRNAVPTHHALIRDFLYGNRKAKVILRPLNLYQFEQVLTDEEHWSQIRKQETSAHYLASGKAGISL